MWLLPSTRSIQPRSPPGRPGQTYAQTLALGGVDVNEYISNGNNRDAFTDAIQPRVGFSFDLTGDERHVLFGGAGRAYDRNVFDYMSLERSKGTFPRYVRRFDAPGNPCTVGVEQDCLTWDPAYFEDPAALEALVAANPQLGREINLIHNDLKTPYSDQFSLGIRNRLQLGEYDWNTSATLAYIESHDGIVFLLGNRWPDGSFRGENVGGAFVPHPEWIWGGQPWGNGLPGIGTLLVAKNGIETRTKQVLLQAEKPYTRESGWSVTLAYTYTDAEENRTNSAFNDEHYIFDYADVGGFGWHDAIGVPRHRFVGTGIWDARWGLTLSAKLTLQSPQDVEALNCFSPAPGQTQAGDNFCFFDNFRDDSTFGLRQLDLALSKRFEVSNDFAMNIRADVFNVFNYENADRYEVWRGFNGEPNDAYGDITAWRQPTRTFKLSFSVDYR